MKKNVVILLCALMAMSLLVLSACQGSETPPQAAAAEQVSSAQSDASDTPKPETEKDPYARKSEKLTDQSVGSVILSGQSDSGLEYELTVSDYDEEGYCLFTMDIEGEPSQSIDLIDDIPELEKYASMIKSWVVQGTALDIEAQFSGCTALSNIIYWTLDEYGALIISGVGEIPEDCAPWNDSADWIASITLEEGITSCPFSAYGMLGNANSISFPATIKKVEVPTEKLALGGWTTDYPHFETVYIQDLAAWCNVEMPEAGHLFSYCSKLYIDGVQTTELIIPDGVESIAPNVFVNMPVTRVVIPDSVKEVGTNALCAFVFWRGGGQGYGENGGINSGKLEYLELGNGITELPDEFCNLEIENLKWGASICKVPSDAFEGIHCHVENLYITDMTAWCNTDVEVDQPYGSFYISIHFPDNLYLNDELVEELVIPSDITVIKPYTFYGIRSIKSVRIPASVTSIQASAFLGQRITDIFFEGTQEQWDKIAILGDDNEFFQTVAIHCEG